MSEQSGQSTEHLESEIRDPDTGRATASDPILAESEEETKAKVESAVEVDGEGPGDSTTPEENPKTDEPAPAGEEEWPEFGGGQPRALPTYPTSGQSTKGRPGSAVKR